MVKGEQLRSQQIIGLPFTVYCLPNAMRSALGALRGIRIVEPFLLMSKDVRSQEDICQQFKVHQSLSSYGFNELLFI
jgi:hypothetical protein